ncbi:MAG: hypothetical protein IPN97_07860 [Saprospiraceae bacterium]|nr:hypothetical protein [Saprospiraceae bacterium]
MFVTGYGLNWTIRIFDGKLIDSVTLQTQNGCDSIIVAIGTVRGLSNFSRPFVIQIE